MIDKDTAKKRLLAQKSYQALTPDARTMVRGYLLFNLAFQETAFLVDLRNPQRTWDSPKVKRVLEDFGSSVQPITDYVAALAALEE